jgi:hypothetical protein
MVKVLNVTSAVPFVSKVAMDWLFCLYQVLRDFYVQLDLPSFAFRSVWPLYGCQCKPCLLIDTCSSSSLKYPKKKVPEAKSRTSQTLEGVPSKSEKIEKTPNNNTCVRLAVTVHWADSLHHHQP